MIRKLSLAFMALLLLPLAAQAASFTGSLDYSGLKNLVSFDTYYAVYNTTSNTIVAPTAYNPGDVLLTLYTATSLSIQTAPNSPNFGPSVWTPGVGDYVVGYSAAKIGAIPILNNPSSDPAGKLAGTTMFGLWSSITNWTVSGDVLTDIQTTIPNLPALGTFQISNGATDGASLQPLVPAFNPLMPALKQMFVTMNGGSLPILSDAVSGTDLASAGIVGTTGGVSIGGVPGWFAGGYESVQFALVPEPGTLALWGSALAIGAVVAFRRRKQN